MKQETLEEVAYKIFSTMPSEISTSTAKYKALELAKWQKEQDKNKYSEEDLLNAFDAGLNYMKDGNLNKNEWFKQFKNK
jgi:hypothetical protein